MRMKCPICKSDQYDDRRLADHLEKHKSYEVDRYMEELRDLINNG